MYRRLRGMREWDLQQTNSSKLGKGLLTEIAL